MRRIFYFHILFLVLMGLFSCTLYRSPDAVIQNKSRALDFYLFAKNTNSPDFYDTALGHAIIPAAYFEKGNSFLRNQEWELARQNYELALYYSRNYGIAASRIQYLDYLEHQELLEWAVMSGRPFPQEERPPLPEIPLESEEMDIPEDREMEEFELFLPPEDEVFEEDSAFRIVTASPFPFREEPAVSTGFFYSLIQDVQFHLDKALLFYQHRLYEDALEELKIIIDTLDYRESSEPYLLLLKIHQALKDERKAVNVIKLMKSLFPEDEEMYFQSGLYFIDRGYFHLAIGFLSSAVNLNSGEPKYYNNLGICYRQTGEIKKAQASYEQAITVDPGFADAYLNLGILYEISLLDIGKAVELYEQYIKLNGPRTNEVRGWIHNLKDNE